MKSSFIPQVFAGSCYVCKKREEPLIACTRCKCISYCSDSHKKQDSKYHDPVCKRWKELESRLASTSKKSKSIDRDLKSLVSKASLGVHDHEIHQLTFHRACCVCRSTTSILKQCEDCLFTFFCEDHLKDETKHCCGEIKLAFEVEELLTLRNHRPDVIVPNISETVNFEEDYHLKDWKHYFSSGRVPGSSCISDGLRALITNSLSLPMTLLYILFNHKRNSLYAAKLLNIHFLGCRLPEIVSLRSCEELFHIMPNLIELKMHFSGPDMDESEATDEEYTEVHLCESCESTGRVMEVNFYRGTFHELFSSISKGSKIKPDVVIAMNAGLWLYPSWKETIDLLLRLEVFSIITAHDEKDAKADAKIVKKMKGKIVVDPSENPFKGLTPVRRPEDLCDVFYRSGNYFCFEGKDKS